MNPYRSYEIFCQSDPVTSDRFERFSAERAVRTDRNRGAMPEQSHLSRTVEPVRLFGRASRQIALSMYSRYQAPLHGEQTVTDATTYLTAQARGARDP